MPATNARLLALVSVLLPSLAIAAETSKPLKVLCVVGGGWHDYATQSQILKRGIEAQVRSHVDVAYSPDTSGKATFDIYGNPEWDKGYDVVIHGECSCDVIDRGYIERILAAHRP